VKHLIALVFVLSAAACGDDDTVTPGCTLDDDCDAAEMCVDQRCVPSTPDAGQDAATDSGPACECVGGEVCRADRCVMECGDPASETCGAGNACDYATGACVSEGAAGALTGSGEECGDTLCLPGTECNLVGSCVPAAPCDTLRCAEDMSACWGSMCRSERPAGACTPAPLERLNESDFIHGGSGGAFDLEFDDICNAYTVTMISGTDYMRQLAPDGTFTEWDGVTNLNMGEVAVRRLPDSEFGMGDGPGKVAFTYTCCPTCGCVGDDPQGVAQLVREGDVNLPMVLTSSTSQGMGPFEASLTYLNAGPAGLTWGRDNTLFVGNVESNGDFVRADVDALEVEVIQTFPERVHASAVFSNTSLLVATAGGTIYRVATNIDAREVWAEVGADVTSLFRDPFTGRVFVSLSGGRIDTYDPSGTLIGEFESTGADGRMTYSPDGFLYYLTAEQATARVLRFALPTSLGETI
jgi:hypothetical protein